MICVLIYNTFINKSHSTKMNTKTTLTNSPQQLVDSGENEVLSPEKEFSDLFERMYKICIDNNWGDPFSYARSREIHMSNALHHKVAETLSGADAIDRDGNEVEYKSTTGKKINATYNGITLQSTWEEQVKYLTEKKIGRYKHHYFTRYADGQIQETWRMDAKEVLNLALTKLKPMYDSEKKRKDPRLGFNITHKYIYKNATQIYKRDD